MGGRIPCRLRAAWHNMDLELRWRLRAQPEQLMKYLNFLKDKQRKQAARAGSLFTDVMTSDYQEWLVGKYLTLENNMKRNGVVCRRWQV